MEAMPQAFLNKKGSSEKAGATTSSKNYVAHMLNHPIQKAPGF
jgi:hypothetical protein